MAIKLLDAVTAVGTSRSVRIGDNVLDHTVDCVFNSTTTTEISAVVLKLQGSETNEDAVNGIVTEAALAVGSTAENVANGAFAYRINNVHYTKGAVAAGTALTAGLDRLSATVGDYKITLSKFGGFKVYVDGSGNIKFSYPALQQAYATVALANTAVDALPNAIDDGTKYIAIGKVLIENDGTEWVAATDDLTGASDVTSVAFISIGSSFIDMATHTFTATELANGRASFVVAGQGALYVRGYLSTLTGTGVVTCRYTPMRRHYG